MDIRAKGKYPSNKLSNFAIHHFVYDGVECASMEGLLQSLKFKNPEMQKHVCTLSGKVAKSKGANKNWKTKQILYWKGREIPRQSEEYQILLKEMFDALGTNEGFKKALLSTGNATLKHSLGHRNPKATILTETEFCSLLTNLREKLKNDK